MKIENNKVVQFQYTLSDANGEDGVLETNQDAMPLAYLHGHQNLLPALEAALLGYQAGDNVVVELAPEDAYGQRQESASLRVPIKHLSAKPKRLRPGGLVKVQTDQGEKSGRIIKAGKFVVDVDMNHPFAGKTLKFDINILDVRVATDEEIAHGHAHGVGGHHH